MIQWKAVQTGDGSVEPPATHLILQNAETEEALYEADCIGIAQMNAIQEEGVIASVRCWWAGGGDDYAVIDGDQILYVQHRWVDEEVGFGEWEEVSTIK